jgi:lipoate-protein ligase A
LRAIESYRRLHGWLREAFAELNAVTRLAPERHPAGSGQCFVGAEQFDLLDETRKIAGAAQRRNRHGLLIQGSVQPPAGLQRSAWESALCAVAARNWSVRWSPYSLPDELAEHANELARRKYARAEYTQQRTAFRA